MKRMFSFFALIIFLFAFTLMAQNYSVDMSKVPNGTYKGSQRAFIRESGAYVYNTTVKVMGGKIVSIETIKYPSNAAKKTAMKIYDQMIKENKVDVDINGVSGATFKVLVYNALTDR